MTNKKTTCTCYYDWYPGSSKLKDTNSFRDKTIISGRFGHYKEPQKFYLELFCGTSYASLYLILSNKDDKDFIVELINITMCNGNKVEIICNNETNMKTIYHIRNWSIENLNCIKFHCKVCLPF